MNEHVPKRHLVYSPVFRAQLAERRAKTWASRQQVSERLRLLDRRDSLATLIDARSTQLAAHVEEYDAIEARLAELEERSTCNK